MRRCSVAGCAFSFLYIGVADYGWAQSTIQLLSLPENRVEAAPVTWPEVVPPTPWISGELMQDAAVPTGEAPAAASGDETATSALPAADCCCHCCRVHPCQCLCPEPAAPCQPCPRVNNINPAWSLILGGWVQADTLFNSARPVAPGTPFFLAPQGPFEDETFDIHARATTIYLAAKGPKIGRYEAGGLIMFALYNDSIVVDRYGLLPYQAYGELKNEDWRFAAGLQMDIFAPVLPTVLPFSFLAASGNAGIYRGQLRAERFYHLASDRQITLTAGISDPNPTILNNDVLSEDNGWPNVELRAACSAGELKQEGLAAVRPFEFGVSGVIGQVRTTEIALMADQVVSDVWGVAGDYRWRVNQKWGLAGEVFGGQGLGTYGGGVLQTVNSATFEAIETVGGWAEVYYYINPCLHTHWGYGVDNPSDDTVAAIQVVRNDTVFANLIWDVTKSLKVGFEFTYRQTEYAALPDNDGFGIHNQIQWKF